MGAGATTAAASATLEAMGATALEARAAVQPLATRGTEVAEATPTKVASAVHRAAWVEPQAEAAKPTADRTVGSEARETREARAQAAAHQVRAQGEPARAKVPPVRRSPPAAQRLAGKAPLGPAQRTPTARGAAASEVTAGQACRTRTIPQQGKANPSPPVAVRQRRPKLLLRRARKPRPGLQQDRQLRDPAPLTRASPFKRTPGSRMPIQARSLIPVPNRDRPQSRSWHPACPERIWLG